MRNSCIRGRGWEYISHLRLGNTLIYSIDTVGLRSLVLLFEYFFTLWMHLVIHDNIVVLSRCNEICNQYGTQWWLNSLRQRFGNCSRGARLDLAHQDLAVLGCHWVPFCLYLLPACLTSRRSSEVRGWTGVLPPLYRST